MMLPDVSHAGSEALAFGETEVAAEHGLSAPIFLRSVAARRCFEPEIKYKKKHSIRIIFYN